MQHRGHPTRRDVEGLGRRLVEAADPMIEGAQSPDDDEVGPSKVIARVFAGSFSVSWDALEPNDSGRPELLDPVSRGRGTPDEQDAMNRGAYTETAETLSSLLDVGA